MIIIRVKIIYMVWEQREVSKIAVLQPLLPRLYRVKNVCFSQLVGVCTEKPGAFSKFPALTQSILSIPLAECFVCGPLLKFRRLQFLL